MKSSSTRLK